MEEILNFVKTENFSLILLALIVLLILAFIILCVRMHKIRKNYTDFMKKLGDGNSLEEMMKAYIASVKDIEKKEDEIEKYLVSLDNNVDRCFQKIGVHRYNAFKDTGSELSFTVAILDKDNTGIMLNGIYSFEGSNVYAKPIEKGESKYVLSQEEKIALEKAMTEKR